MGYESSGCGSILALIQGKTQEMKTWQIFLTSFLLLTFLEIACEGSDTRNESCPSTDCLNPLMERDLRAECPEIDRNVRVGYAPSAGSSSGSIERKVKGDGSVDTCAALCCQHLTCNFALMANNACFTLSCNRGPRACAPKMVSKAKATSGDVNKMVLVRVPTAGRSKLCWKWNLNRECQENEVCESLKPPAIIGQCKCKANFVMNLEGQCADRHSNVEGHLDERNSTTGDTTPAPMITSSTAKPVDRLDVLGMNKTVILPDNEATAKVLPGSNQEQHLRNQYTESRISTSNRNLMAVCVAVNLLVVILVFSATFLAWMDTYWNPMIITNWTVGNGPHINSVLHYENKSILCGRVVSAS